MYEVIAGVHVDGKWLQIIMEKNIYLIKMNII